MKKFIIAIIVILFSVNAFAQMAAMRPNADYICLSFVDMGQLNMSNPVIKVSWEHEGTFTFPGPYWSDWTFTQILPNGGRYDTYPNNQYPYDWLKVKVTVNIGVGINRYHATKELIPGGNNWDHITFYGSDFKNYWEREATVAVSCEK